MSPAAERLSLLGMTCMNDTQLSSPDFCNLPLNERLTLAVNNLRSGSPILSRIATYYPDRFEKYIFLDIGYQAPGQLFTEVDIKANQDVLGYQIFFNEDGSGSLLDAHVRSLRSTEAILLTPCSKTQSGPLRTRAMSLNIGRPISPRQEHWRPF